MSRVPRQLAAKVARRARHRCEYCHLPEDASLYAFQPDHVIAIKHGGPTNDDNLAWTCFYCNSYKGACVAGYDPDSARLTRLFHPRSDKWKEHFKRQRGRIIGTTPVGRTTVLVLNINHPDAIMIREELIADGRLNPRDD
jgi:hypothetical protein